MCADRPRVLTIPPGASFLDTLTQALLAGRIIPGWPDASDPLSLSTGIVYLPTRRAARALARALADQAGTDAILLPRIVPLGDIEDAEDARILDPGTFADPDLDRPEASPTRRRLVLARLILDWSRTVDRSLLRLDPDEQLLVSASPADALALAGELGMLIDTLAIHGKTVDDIRSLIPENVSLYWDISHAFLQIAAAAWPAWCDEQGVQDPAVRRHRLLMAEADRLLATRPDTPMIAAGSTGSMPATAALLAAIARMPNGAVVLPGLDTVLDDPSFDTVLPRPDTRFSGHPGHPQSMLARLLEAIGILRRDVETIGQPTPALAARDRFLSEALRPAEMTALWSRRSETLPDAEVERALADIAVVEAANDREEAAAIAVALRHAVEDPQATAMLVTPDRGLAERVAAELGRWDIAVEDSAGQALDRSSAGGLARLAAEAAVAGFAAGPLLALLSHPLCRLGLGGGALARARAALDIGVLRAPALPPGIAALRKAAADAPVRCGGRHAKRPQRRLGEKDWAALDRLLQAVDDAFAAFPQARGADIDLVDAVLALEPVIAALGRGPEADDDVFATPSGQSLATLFDDLREGTASGLAGRLADVPAFLHRLMAGRVAPRHGATHPRIAVLGLLEARLLRADLVILGGLDEKTWPPEARTDAFMNRPMRLALGLPAPERRLGQTAHDLVQAMGAPRVILSRALKRGGDPTVASRFLQRMQAVAGRERWDGATARGARWLALARALDRTGPPKPAARPAPRPPVDRFPRSLSITEVETLVRDPYSIYARHILGLDALEPVAGSPDAALRGTIIHNVLGAFAKEAGRDWPADPVRLLLDLGREAFAAAPELAGRADVAAFWWPRFERIARFMARWEEQRRSPGLAVEAEIDGLHEIAVPGLDRPFVLRGRADRIEVSPGGGLRIVDFKTGRPPGLQEVRVGFSPQLTIEAAMAKAGAFPTIPPGGPIEELLYVHVSGGTTPASERFIRGKVKGQEVPPPEELAAEHMESFVALLRELAAGERAFLSRPHPKFAKSYADYDHLARVREWSLAGDGDDEGGDET